ncbi:Branched-chain alpha-keto acid dehydrogenase, E1 component, alpha subunit [Euzebya pacifica]|uniref:2-oxoisovalerate dehydrogenase subunit alpha n=1 Tax=Euzebya pacifica TaxID=1608957 RepID=A0A346XY05_9ACTN|nr:thiamine pyrophosphate-dependent enzyme [Euzebya pacifica]AXV07102.1 Branched-chain alpha-keto acid dehydrogenase, E1 component, alpha subunit [Euzebya pacifica]
MADPSVQPLRLTVPEPAFRPGDTPSYDDMDLPAAGDAPRPAVDTPPEDMRDLAYGLIRVLDDDDYAVGEWNPELSVDTLVTGLRHMLTVREFDKRMQTAQRTGKTSFYMQCLGEEAIACASRMVQADGDMNFPTYRQQGLLIADDYPLVDMMCQIYSNERDPVRGRQLPVMYSSKAQGFFTISGNLATQFSQAVGWAMASAIKGDTKVAAGWIGDGSTAEGDFHSALVFASTYNAPVVLNIVNNQWAISTYQTVARGGAATFAARGHGFGIPSLRVDGNDYLAVSAAAKWATDRARRSLGPTLIEWLTYRAGAHSTSDDPTGYRPKDEYEKWPLGDPVERLHRHLAAISDWSAADRADMEAEIKEQVADAQREAERYGTLHDNTAQRDIFEGVFEHMPPHLERQRAAFLKFGKGSI